MTEGADPPESSGPGDPPEDAGDPADADASALGAAVDDAMAEEVRRQKARFVQRIIGLDRRDGTGRADEQWNSELDRRLGIDQPPNDDGPPSE